MKDKADPNPRAPSVDVAEREMERRRAGSRPVSPTAAKHSCKSLEQVESAALDHEKRRRQKPRDRQPDGNGDCDCRVGPEIEQPNKGERGISELRKQFE